MNSVPSSVGLRFALDMTPFTHELVVHAADVRLEALNVRRDRAALFNELLEAVVEDEPFRFLR